MKTFKTMEPPNPGLDPVTYQRELSAFLLDLQRRMEEAANAADPHFLLQYLHGAPIDQLTQMERIQEGELRLIDGSDYDLGEGGGIYLRDEDNAAWGFMGPAVDGTWTPSVTFATPGDLAVTYSVQTGTYRKTGKRVDVAFSLVTSAFTHTTAAGLLTLTGLPFAGAAGYTGPLDFQGITKAGYTNFVAKTVAATTTLQVAAGGSGVVAATVLAADTPTGGTLRLVGSLTYLSE